MVLNDPWGPHPNREVILGLWIADRLRGGYGPKLERQLKEAVDCAGAGDNLKLAFRIGDFSPVISKGWIQGLINRMDEQGGYYFQPDKKHEPLGTRGYTTLGDCARPLLQLLRYAGITGDGEVKDAALRGLRFIERFNVPRGAQTWEIPLHTPDVLASAYGVEIYLEAYRLTKDRSYLERAIYWAKTGLPFIYLWNADDQSIMLYGSIPVFGGTWFTGLWFGRLVQWCGLDYAYSLIRLAKYDSSLPWRRIAEGITISGMQQQNWTTEDDPSHKGMYPDAFDVTIGRPPYKWDLSPIKILRNLLAIVGHDEELSTVILDGVHITSATGITHAERHDGTITVELSKPLSSMSFVLVTDVDEPGGVTADGNVIHRKSRNRESESWWDYMEDRRFLLIKVKHEDKVVLRIS